jgi:hypothetical protein
MRAMKAHKKTRIKGHIIFLHNPSVHSKTIGPSNWKQTKREDEEEKGEMENPSDSHPAFVVVLLCKSFFWWLTSRA